ncbi:DNA mismatch repair endonuclease MutL [Vibrio sp. DW001]|uniref:DNA mismatch repair endonuclease MutL n=1 Tax=Vibrio sp. DW001 TaxID=2912315 RepID=UPI0023AE960F|nr:DNA mismatch repair endonuclease MutL [Vibrio sp. DW001]WED26934.1 DNA mismatch repair endonuclease MutL [Vibrio sp. DW001]
MTIKILPARLANQIAAGEVVERPASVVKELVENSLDSGATRIDIDIEKGGSKLIRVRDNGKGIVKDELALALSRHATSKIHTLDDLEAIMSLGFRGEALASISAVSRLTLTSRTATQEQAWSAYSEGRDMEVKLQPTAHPIGSTVEVLDLFFNTPARRKFLRTDKTEFTHIDELLKRIALSRFDVTINLKHNGKLARQYRTAKNSVQTQKRIAAVCGSNFVRNMLNIELEHNGLRLHGWITSPEGARQQSDLQYCYVNGRMMRDKLINHAIRQSYASSLRPEQFASYVLFIEIDPHQVDVNVHPAKHEVRFHQGRLVHDFIYQALADSLSQSFRVDEPKALESAYHTEPVDNTQNQVMEAVNNFPAYPGRPDYADSVELDKTKERDSLASQEHSKTNWVEPLKVARVKTDRSRSENHKQEAKPSKRELKNYNDLLATPHIEPIKRALVESQVTAVPIDTQVSSIGKAFSIVGQQFLLTQSDIGEVLISLMKAEWYRVLGQLQTDKHFLTPQPLLVPLSIKMTKQDLATYKKYQDLLGSFAIQLKEKNSSSILVMAVPQPLRQQNLQKIIPELLSFLTLMESDSSTSDVANWLADQITLVKSRYTLSEGIQLLSELEQLWDGILPLHDSTFVQTVNFKDTISMFVKS